MFDLLMLVDFVIPLSVAVSNAKINLRLDFMFEELSEVNDTSPEAEALLVKMMREMTPTEKIKRMLDLCTVARAMVIAGIKERHKEISPEEEKKYFAAIMLGPEFTKRYYKWDPEIEGY